MTILQQPDALSLSGNIKDFRISTPGKISFVLLQGATEILSQSYDPGQDGLVTISLKDIIHSCLSFQLQESSQVYLQPTLADTFTARFSDEYVVNPDISGDPVYTDITFRAVRAGIDRFADTATNFLTQNFLTWQPTVKPVTYYSPEFLTYYAVVPCIVKLRAYFTDDSGSVITQKDITLSDFEAGKAYTIPLQYASVAGKLDNELPGYYDVWIENTEGVRLTYIQRYYASDMLSEQEQWILFENSLGGIDTFRAYGSSDFTGEHTHNIAEIEDNSLEYRVDTERKFQKNTGHLNAQERRWLLDFFPSLSKYIYTGSYLRPIVVTESNVTYTDRELPSNYTFTYKYADARPFLNIPRTEPAGDLNITVPGVGSFTVPPRLVEFPRLPLTEGALFPVQDPYSEKWYTATSGSLSDFIAERIAKNYVGGGGIGHQHNNFNLLELLSYGEEYLLVSGKKIKSGIADEAHSFHKDTARNQISFLKGLSSEKLIETKEGIRIGDGLIEWDPEYDILRISKSDGSAAGIAASGGVSAKGYSPGSGGGVGGASALYQLVDVIANSTGTGVEGAVDGSILKYDALADKWKAGEAGLNENQLAAYLSTNNYAKKSDIPSLAGYATEKWVTDKGYLVATASDKANWNAAYGWGNHALSGYAKQTDLKTVSDKLNSFLSGESISDTIDNWKEFQKVFENFPDSANMVELLRGKVDITTSVKAGTGLTGGGPLSKDITLSLGETGVSVGTYTKLTVDKYGRVTSGTSLIASDIPSLAISKITGLQDALNSKLNSNDFQSKFDAAIAAWFVRDEGNKGIRPAAYQGEEIGFYSNTYLSAKGRAAGSGGGGGGASALYQLLDVIPNASGTGVEGVADGYVLAYDALAGKWKAAQRLDETALKAYLTTNKYATQGWVSGQGYLTQHQSLANYVTLNTAQEITGDKTFFSSNGNLRTVINGRDIITVHNSNYVGGWTRGLIFRKADGATNYGTFGAYGSDQALNYLYIGQSYVSPWITFNDTLVKSNIAFEASSIRKTGGTSAQFLKADGSIDSNSYLTTVSASSTYVRKVGDIMTGALTVPNLTISRTDPVKHIAFSRADFNYITAPANGTIAFITKNVDVGASVSDFMISTGIIRPGTTNVVTNGNSSYRWSNIYSVLGNFSGVITAGSHINAVGNINADGTITSGRDVVANNYIKSTNGWFQNDVAQAGLYNKAGDARWMWNGSYWYADKSIYSTNLIKGKTLESYVSTGTAPLVVASSTLVKNLNANYVGGYDSGRLLRTKAIGSRVDYEKYVILLFQTEEIANHRLDGYFYTSTNGSNRYYRTDVSIWHSRWSSTGQDGTYSCINKNYQEGGLKLITVTYQGKEWVAMDSANASIQAKSIYFAGDWSSNVQFTLVSYYKVASSTPAAVLNSEINDSRKDLASDNILVGNNTIAYISSNVASATKLQTARKIWGASFDGTSDIAGDISGATRIYNAANSNFYIGNSSNTGWVFTQNIASHDAINNWSIRTSGVGHFKRINLGDAEEDNTSYRLVIRGDQFMYGNIVSPWYRVNYSSNNPYYNLTKDNVTAYFQLYDTKAYLGFGTANSLNITQDGKVGIGIGTTNPSYKLHVAGTGYFSGSLTTSGNIATGSNDGAFVRIGNVYLQYDATNNAIKVVKYDGSSANLYATGGLSAKGLAEGSGGGGGGGLIQNVYGYTDLGKTYSNADLDNTFNAYTINQLATRITSLEGGSAMTFNTTGTGEFFSAVSKNGTTVTFTKRTPNYINSSTTERDIKPNSTGNGLLKLYFLNGTQSGIGTGAYYDALYLSSYVDNSGGGSNLITFNKSNGEMAIHYQAFGATAWGTRRVVLDSGNFANYAPTKTGGGASGSWGINITGNANSATSLQNIRYIGISGGATGSKTSFNGTYDITIPVTKIDPSKSYYENGKLLIKKVVAQYITDTNDNIGIIKITLPTGWSASMMGIEIDVYQYAGGIGYSKILVGGYNYNGSSAWINTSVSILGSYDYKVRLGYDGSKCCILLGTTTYNWHYPKVVVRNVMSGYTGYASLDGTWSTSLITTESGLSSIVEPVVNTGMTVGIARGCSGNAATSSKWATARSISLTGAITGSVSLDGSSNVSLATTFADNVFDARYVKKSGDTMTGILTVNKSIILIQDWVRFNIAGRGLYNVSGDARWYWDGSSWYSDKNIFAAGNITGTRLMSNVAQGTSPLVVTSTTRVENLNADLLDNYHASGIATANTVVIRDANNYTYLKYISSSTNIAENGDLDQFIVTKPNDNFYRKYSRDYVRIKLNEFEVNRKVLDLTSLNENTYYPCSIVVSSREPTTISIFVALNSGSKPSWSTHASGFTMSLSWQVFGGGWGTNVIQRKILNSTAHLVADGVNPCGGIEQNTMASTEIVYLRGGAKYFYKVSNSINSFAINSSGYTWSSGNYSYSAPTISAPKKHPSLCYEASSMLGAYNIYANYLQISSISVDGTVTAATYKSGKSMFQDGQLELSGATPYIDFHHNNSTADYTHRIIAETADRLNITTGLQVNGILYGKGNLNIGSTIVSNVEPTGTNTWSNLSTLSPVLSMGNYSVAKDSIQPMFRWANQIPEGYISRYIIGSHRPSSAGFGQLRLWVGNNDAGTSGNWFALNHNGVVSTSLTYFETSNTGFKTGNVVFGAKGSVAEISSATNHLLVSGYSDIHVNYTASGTGRTIPTKWYWHRGAANTWADFEIGLLTTHASAYLGGDVTITDDLNVTGSTTFAGHVIAGMGLDVIDLTYLQDDLQVDGYSSFNSDVTINANVGMYGTINLIGGTIRGDSKSKIICDGIGISTGNKESGCIISGNPSSWNIAFDHNDIQARNNGIMSVLYLNDYGGDVSMTNASSAYGVKILSTKASTSYSNGALTVGGGIGVGGSIYTRGNVIADGAISAKSASDQRLKTNFDRNVRYDERLLSLGCVLDYSYNALALQRGEGGVDRNRHTGLIYQNVEKIMPHITYKSADGYGSINYISPDFIATIAGATQLNTLGLRSVVRNAASLEKRISLLEKENDKLKSEIKRLGGRI